MKKLYIFISTVFVFFHIYTAFFGVLPGIAQRAIHLILMLVLVFGGAAMQETRSVWQKVADFVFLGMGFASVLYVMLIDDSYSLRSGIVYPIDIVFGIMLIVTLLEATRRKVGISLSIVVLAFITYAFGGMYLPGFLEHSGFQLGRFLHLTVHTADGIFGTALNASAGYIVIFIILGAVFNETGVGDYFTTVASAAFGKLKGGPAKVATIASGFFGSISGSSIANVVSTGTFTIPMMKKCGFQPEYAGAVEATASTGGQIMPPIMGAAAFLVAEIIQVPYFDIVKAAAIPAILYYAAILMTVDAYAHRRDIKGISAEDIPTIKELLKKAYLFFPLILLIILLGPLRLSVTRAGVYTLIFTLIITSFNANTRMNKERFIRAMKGAANGTIPVAIACAIVGVIIATVMGTGLGFRLSILLVDLSGGKLVLLLFLTMVVSLILGMGLPTSAAYLVLATLVAPAIIKLGVQPIAAHLFIFYFGVISNITPPVALAAYAAAGIAQCNPNKTGFKAFRIALSGFIIPFVFVYEPVLLLQGTWYAILYSLTTALVGIYCLSVSGERFLLSRWTISRLEQFLLFAAALTLIYPGWLTDLIGTGILAAVILFRLFVSKKDVSVDSKILSN